jgi:hypothetical protein
MDNKGCNGKKVYHGDTEGTEGTELHGEKGEKELRAGLIPIRSVNLRALRVFVVNLFTE